MSEDLINFDEFLEHFGVKGMKWGVRKSSASVGKATRSKTRYKERAASLSSEELQSRIRRLEMEKRYSELNSPTKAKGRQFLSKQLENIGRDLVVAVAGTATTLVVKNAIEKKLKG